MRDFAAMAAISGPAILTNLATPVGNVYVFRTIAQFGENAVAAFAIIDRLVPVAFGVIFALSGAVGPVLGQNLGAKLFGRVRRTMSDSFLLTFLYCAAVWFILFLASGLIVGIFNANAETARYVRFFCTWGVGAWVFLGFLFVANAGFNNLGQPLLSTVFNWGRATLGTIPFVTLGAQRGGVEGGMIGIALGALIFGAGALAAAYFTTNRLAKNAGTA